MQIRGNEFQIMVMGLVQIGRNVRLAIHGLGGIRKSGRLDTIRRCLMVLFHVLLTSEIQMVHDMRYVRHVRGHVVIGRLGLNVEMAGCAIHEKGAGDATSGMFVGFPLFSILVFLPCGLFNPDFFLVRNVHLVLGNLFRMGNPIRGRDGFFREFEEHDEIVHIAMSPVIVGGLAINKQTNCGVLHNVVLKAQHLVGDAVHLANHDWKFELFGTFVFLVCVIFLVQHPLLGCILHDFGECFPGWGEYNAMRTPAGERNVSYMKESLVCVRACVRSTPSTTQQHCDQWTLH